MGDFWIWALGRSARWDRQGYIMLRKRPAQTNSWALARWSCGAMCYTVCIDGARQDGAHYYSVQSRPELHRHQHWHLQQPPAVQLPAQTPTDTSDLSVASQMTTALRCFALLCVALKGAQQTSNTQALSSSKQKPPVSRKQAIIEYQNAGQRLGVVLWRVGRGGCFE